jgi:hypothetical protein
MRAQLGLELRTALEVDEQHVAHRGDHHRRDVSERGRVFYRGREKPAHPSQELQPLAGALRFRARALLGIQDLARELVRRFQRLRALPHGDVPDEPAEVGRARSMALHRAQGEAGEEGRALPRPEPERPLPPLLLPDVVEPPPEGAQIAVRHEGGERLADEEAARHAQELGRGGIRLANQAARVGHHVGIGALLEEATVLRERGDGGVAVGRHLPVVDRLALRHRAKALESLGEGAALLPQLLGIPDAGGRELEHALDPRPQQLDMPAQCRHVVLVPSPLRHRRSTAPTRAARR